MSLPILVNTKREAVNIPIDIAMSFITSLYRLAFMLLANSLKTEPIPFKGAVTETIPVATLSKTGISSRMVLRLHIETTIVAISAELFFIPFLTVVRNVIIPALDFSSEEFIVLGIVSSTLVPVSAAVLRVPVKDIIPDSRFFVSLNESFDIVAVSVRTLLTGVKEPPKFFMLVPIPEKASIEEIVSFAVFENELKVEDIFETASNLDISPTKEPNLDISPAKEPTLLLPLEKKSNQKFPMFFRLRLVLINLSKYFKNLPILAVILKRSMFTTPNKEHILLFTKS